MMNHGGGPTLPQRQVERLQHQFGAQMGFHRPADDSAAESVEHYSQVKKPGPSRDVSYVGDPQPIGRRGDEGAVHQSGCRPGSAPVSVANQAAAFESISRSSRSTRFSRRNRLSSSRSAVVSPSLRRPSSSPACLTHLRIALAEASNSRANCAIGRPARANSMIRRPYSSAYAGCVLGIGGLLLPLSPTPAPNSVQP